MKFDPSYTSERMRMVETQVEKRGIYNHNVLEAMRRVPRHLFVPEAVRDYAYRDGPLEIGEGQTISQPYIVALMTALLRLQGGERVLEVGTGSGYQAAILAEIAGEVHTIERHARLAQQAKEVLDTLGYTNITVHIGDGTLGAPAHAPYAAILVAAAAPHVPQALLDQLDDGGRLVLPVGAASHTGGQVLQRWERHGPHFEREDLIPVAFVPLIGEQGWEDKDF
jgi:protein-L-isoaspartate(D-aspartate) O-methyltransferase